MQHPYEPFVSLEARVAHLEGRVEQGFADVRDRLDEISHRFNGLEQRFDARFSHFENRFAQLENRMGENVLRIERKSDRQFFWLLGVLIVSILLPFARSAAHFPNADVGTHNRLMMSEPIYRTLDCIRSDANISPGG